MGVSGEAEQRKRFAFALQQAMDARKLSARQLAKQLGDLDARLIARWLNGKALPNLYQAEALVHVLRIREELFRNPPPVPERPAYPIGDYLLGPTSGEAGLVEGVRRGQDDPAPTVPGTPVRSPRRRPLDAGAGRG
jgi:transcriptional regulator with XRE-family HTH domain